MTTETGTGTGSAYEYVIAERKTVLLAFKKAALIVLYVLWAITFLLVGAMTRLIAPILGFIPLTLWIIVFLTWRYTQVEYEYSFLSGRLTVSRILGSRSRKKLVTLTIRELSAILPCEEPYLDRINAFGAQKEIFAASHNDSPELYAAMWEEEDGTRRLLWFEPNERAIKILRYYNMSAVTVRK